MSYYVRRKNDFDWLENDFFRSIFNDSTISRQNKNAMKTDVEEKENSYEVSVEMPGYSKDNIELSLEKGYLTISANVKTEEEKNEKNYIRKERYVGQCSRSFYVGDEYKESDIKASFVDGVLKIVLPKIDQKNIETKKSIAIE